MQKISELLNIKVTAGNPLTIYHPVFENKEIYWECSTGYWEKREFDSNGYIIYYEDSKGNWHKYEYDNYSNCIYCDVNDGDWTKREYDNNGDIIYFENSYGTIEDNRAKELKLTLEQIADKFNISVNQLKIKK